MFKGKSLFFNSKLLIILIGVVWSVLFFTYKPWQKNMIVNDVVSYYCYLPATFIYHDLSLKFSEKDPFFADKYWPQKAPNGGKVIKMSMGLSMLYAPFFFIGHLSAAIFHQPQDGYSTPYQVCLALSCLFYLLLGLFYLRKLLLFYFSEGIVALTIASLFFGTNLFWYSTSDGLMSHGYLFCMLSVFVYQVVCWHREPKLKRLIYIGLTGGLLTLIRPTMILCFLFFFLFGIYNKKTLIAKMELLKKNIPGLLILALSSFIVLLPQLAYWKYVTGNWLFYSYIGEHFYFNHPHVLEGLLGFRKGWLIYTPIMFLSLAGFICLMKNMKEYMLAIPVPFIISIYVVFSWWCWWYGGSFGQRPMVDFYGMLAIPMACFYQKVFDKGKWLLRAMLMVVITGFVILNLFQMNQYNNGVIHYDSMTGKAYRISFSETKPTVEWYEALEEPDYPRAQLGLPEIVSQDEIAALSPEQKIFLTAANLRNVSCEIGTTTELTASRYSVDAWEKFSLIHLGGNKVALKADNDKYVCADREQNWKLLANRVSVGNWETFELIYTGNGNIVLKADNKKYVTIEKDTPNILIAKSDKITKSEQFRLHISYK